MKLDRPGFYKHRRIFGIRIPGMLKYMGTLEPPRPLTLAWDGIANGLIGAGDKYRWMTNEEYRQFKSDPEAFNPHPKLGTPKLFDGSDESRRAAQEALASVDMLPKDEDPEGLRAKQA
jgi:hypothetical protein